MKLQAEINCRVPVTHGKERFVGFPLTHRISEESDPKSAQSNLNVHMDHSFWLRLSECSDASLGE